MTSESITPQIVCKSYQHIHFKHSWYIGISNLEFIGCGGNQVKSVDKFVVKDTVTVFNGLNTSSTALEIIVSVIQIANSTFKFHGSNPRGLYQSTAHSNLAGGAIIATGSVINMRSKAWWSYNYMLNNTCSIIIIHSSTFTNNSAEYGGGALHSLLSVTVIEASEFDFNAAQDKRWRTGVLTEQCHNKRK